MSTGTRRKSRELAMQMLFQGDIGKQTPDQVQKTFWSAGEAADADTRGFAEDLYRVATVRSAEIDELIVAHLVNLAPGAHAGGRSQRAAAGGGGDAWV